MNGSPSRTSSNGANWVDKAGVKGEILIVDSSSDETPQLALARGARVPRTRPRGLGHAYIDAIPYIRGKYVLMGDADCTYNFREISGFVEQIREDRRFASADKQLFGCDAANENPVEVFLTRSLTASDTCPKSGPGH